MVMLPKQRQRYFFIIKLVRLKRGLQNLDIDIILKWYKKKQQKQLDELIQSDPKKANSMDED